MIGLLFCVFGLGFGMAIYMPGKTPGHKSMLKFRTDLRNLQDLPVTQGKFLMLLWAFIAAHHRLFFGVLRHFEISRRDDPSWCSAWVELQAVRVAWFGIRVNTFANSRPRLASLPGKPTPSTRFPLESRHADRNDADLGRTAVNVFIFYSSRATMRAVFYRICDWPNPLGAAALRIAGESSPKSPTLERSDEDRFKIKEDDARNPGRMPIAPGDNAGDSVGLRRWFETYG